MCPALYASLPRKLDRRALPDPATIARTASGAYVAPTNPIEERLAQIWATVLNVPQVGIRDNFFMELGGHSLLATRLMVRIRDTFHIELQLRSIFEAPTVEGLAQVIAEIRKDVGSTQAVSIPRLPREQYRLRAS
jgi:acyl carrier protein